MDIENDNELLAHFIGYSRKDGGKFHCDWNQLMLVLDKIRSYPIILNMEEDGSVSLNEFKIGMNSMLLEYSKRINGKTVIGHSYHVFIDGDQNKSNCETYIEMVYKCCVDFVKFINEKGM